MRHAPVHAGPLQLRRKSMRSPGPRTRSLTERPFCISGRGSRATNHSGERTTQQQRVDVAQLEEHRSPEPAAGGSTPSVHANRGRSHGHRTRDLAERPAKQRGTGLTVTWPWGHLSPLRPQRWGVRANSIVDSIRQEPDPHDGSASCRRSDPRRRRRGCQRCGTRVGWAIGWPAWP